jgi:hypothetical protein
MVCTMALTRVLGKAMLLLLFPIPLTGGER